MAKIIRKGKDLEKDYLCLNRKFKTRLTIAISFMASGMLVAPALFLLLSSPIFMILPFFCWVVAVVFFILASAVKSELDILAAGINGENLANRCVSLLPDSYTAFRNLTVTYDGKSSELDIVVVGPTGIFVVETKALNGTICGDVNNSQWVQQKVGRGGTPYSKSFYSPIKQVNTHVYRLANNLRSGGIRTYVNAIVYFSNVETSFCLTGVSEKTPVFNAQNNGANQMLNYIVNREKILTQQECEKIVDVIIKL